MTDFKAIFALIIQWGVMIVTYILTLNHSQSNSMYYGAVITFVILLLRDALPWISIWKTEFTFQPKWHHSRIGVFCLFLALVYKGIITLLYDRWLLIKRFHYFIEEKVWNFGPIKFHIFYMCLSIAILLVETQLHEIIYFGKFKFPDRGFPLDIRLKLGG